VSGMLLVAGVILVLLASMTNLVFGEGHGLGFLISAVSLLYIRECWR
jgi:hypothetical protein